MGASRASSRPGPAASSATKSPPRDQRGPRDVCLEPRVTAKQVLSVLSWFKNLSVIYIYIYIYIYTYIHTHIYIYIHIYTHTYIHILQLCYCTTKTNSDNDNNNDNSQNNNYMYIYIWIHTCIFVADSWTKPEPCVFDLSRAALMKASAWGGGVVLFDSEGFVWSGRNAPRDALEAKGP